MRHINFKNVPAEEVEEGAQGVSIRWLIRDVDGAKNFFMRHFEIAPGGHTPRHSHPWEHEVFILEGNGVVLGAEGEKEFSPGDVIFVPAGEEHQFRNPSLPGSETGEKPVAFLCLIPSKENCIL
jgi:quercetin dioxygenase-like cupin family protein